MNDTDPRIEAKMDEPLRARTPEERMLMGAAMFDTAKAMALAGIRNDHPQFDEAEIRRALFLRFYGDDFDPVQRDKIADWLMSKGNP